MSKFIGRRTQCAIGREEVAYGTKSSQIIGLALQEVTIDTTKDVLLNDQAYNLIEDNCGSAVGKKAAEITLSGITSGDSIGQFLMAVLGTLSTDTATPVAGTDTHTFTVKETNDAESYTIIYKDDNQTKQILGAVLTRFEASVVAGEWVINSATFMGIFPTTTTEIIVVSKDEPFTASMAVAKIATNVAGLAAASAVPLETGSIVIEKNAESHFIWGSVDVNKVHNKQMALTGSFELLFDDLTYFSKFEDHTISAMSITLTTDEYITGTTPFSLEFTIPTFHIATFSQPRPLEELVKQSFAIKAEYDTTTKEMIDAVLVNTTGNVY